MFLAYVPVVAMATGLIAYARALELANGTGAGPTARYEAERAAESGALLSILTVPWLVTAAIILA
jgi:hypothetical protein